MARYALIRGGTVMGFREAEDPTQVALHKISDDGGPLLRPVVDPGPPAYRRELHRLSTNIVVERDRVLVTHEVVPLATQKDAVKAEARRRILAAYPEWQQANMTARGVELLQIQVARGLSDRERAEVAALQEAWDWIKAVRVTSDTIEALDPIPDDYDDDERWP